MMPTRFARKFLYSFGLGFLFAAATTGVLAAQSTTQGAISGTVFDSTNAAIPKATIRIVNDGTNAELTLTSGDAGNFKAPQLMPGTYTVTISAPGFGESKNTGVVVEVQTVTEVNPHLNAGSEATVVQVEAELPVIQLDSPSLGGHLSNREIENIPINNRRWSSLALTTPGVTNDGSGFGLLSFRAIASVLNNVQIDGADDNQAFFSEERGRTRAGYSTSQAMVREFQVNSGVYAADFGRAVGGVINSVTKTGTNQLHGEAYFYRRDDQFGAYNSSVTIGSFNSAGAFSTRPYRPKDKRNQYGFEFGGPIIKDKLFYVYAFDVFDRQFPGLGRANSPANFFAAPSTATVALLASRLNVTTAAASTAYNTQLQAIATDLGSVPRYGHQNINTPKINWQINPKNNVSFLYHRLRWDSPGGVQTQASNGYAVDSFGTDFVKLDYGVAKLDSLITSRIANELRYQYGRELNDEGQQPFSGYTKQFLQNSTTGNVSSYSIFNSQGFNAGQQSYSNRVAYPDERKWQIADTLSINLGRHNVRIGEDIVHNYDLQNQLFGANGAFTYSTSLVNFISDVLAPNGSCDATRTAAGNSPCYDLYSQGFGAPIFDFVTTDYGFFVQDDWKFTPRLTLNIGVRYDYQSFPQPYAKLVTIPLTTNHPSDKNNIAPRVGFAYDPFGKGKTVIRGGFGLYYGRIPNSLILNTFQATGSAASQTTYSFTPQTAGAPSFRQQIATQPVATGTGNISYFDKNFQSPGTYQMDLAMQQDLGHSNVLSVQYLGALGRQLSNSINANLIPTNTYNATYTVATAPAGGCGVLACGTSITNKVYAGRIQTSPTGTLSNVSGTGAAQVPYTQYAGVYDIISNINSNYHALSVDVTNRSYRWATFDANYTWAHALDFSQNNGSSSSGNNWIDPFGNQRLNYGNSNLDVRHRAVGWAILNAPGVANDHSLLGYVVNGWSIRPLVQIQTGLPYSATVAGSTPQSCYAVNCLASSAATTSGLLGTGVSYIPLIGRNSFKIPRSILIDARLQKSLKLYDRYTLELFAEAFNLANHQNVTGINSSAYTIATTKNGTAAPTVALTPNASFGTVSAYNGNYAYSPRQFQFAARVTF